MYKHLGNPYHLSELLHGSELFKIVNTFLDNLHNVKIIDDDIGFVTNRSLYFNEFLNLYSFAMIEPSDIETINELIDEFISNYQHDSFIILLLPSMVNGLFPVKDDSINLKLTKICNNNKLNIEFLFAKHYDEDLLKELNKFIERISSKIYENTNLFADLCSYFEPFLNQLRKSSFLGFKRFLSNENNTIDNVRLTCFEFKPDAIQYDSIDRYLILEKLFTISNFKDLTEISERKRALIYSILLKENNETIRKYISNYKKSYNNQTKKAKESYQKVENLFKTTKFLE